MSRLDVLQSLAPHHTEVVQVLPTLFHLRCGRGLPLVRITCSDGWTTVAANICDPQGSESSSTTQRGHLFSIQARHAAIKLALQPADAAGRSPLQMRAEIPGDLTRPDETTHRWVRAVLAEFHRALNPDPANSAQESPPGVAAQVSNNQLSEGLAELGYAVQAQDDFGLSVNLPSQGQVRRVAIQPIQAQSEEGGCWWRASLPLGTGDALALDEPMGEAVRLYLLRIAGGMKLVRPYWQNLDDGKTLTLGFETHLPEQPNTEHLEHALAALVTAVQRYELDIESLATEAILAHAYVAITGGPKRAANPSNHPEL